MLLKIIKKEDKYTRIFYFPKENISYCDVDNYKLVIADKYDRESPFEYCFCTEVDPTDEKFNSLILEIMDKSVDTEITLNIGNYNKYDDTTVDNIICSSKNNFHIYILEHAINLK